MPEDQEQDPLSTETLPDPFLALSASAAVAAAKPEPADLFAEAPAAPADEVLGQLQALSEAIDDLVEDKEEEEEAPSIEKIVQGSHFFEGVSERGLSILSNGAREVTKAKGETIIENTGSKGLWIPRKSYAVQFGHTTEQIQAGHGVGEFIFCVTMHPTTHLTHDDEPGTYIFVAKNIFELLDAQDKFIVRKNVLKYSPYLGLRNKDLAESQKVLIYGEVTAAQRQRDNPGLDSFVSNRDNRQGLKSFLNGQTITSGDFPAGHFALIEEGEMDVYNGENLVAKISRGNIVGETMAAGGQMQGQLRARGQVYLSFFPLDAKSAIAVVKEKGNKITRAHESLAARV